MRVTKALIRVFLSGVQAIAFLAPFVLNYFGSHRMGAHRHLKVRGDEYVSGILNHTNLTIAAIVVAAALVLLLCLLFFAVKQRPQIVRPRSIVLIAIYTLALLLLMILPAAKSLLIFPWLLFCAVLIWVLQLAKAVLLHRQDYAALIKSCFSRNRPTGEKP